MDLRYIITRAFTLLIVIVLVLYGIGFVKKQQRRSAIISDLKSLASESSFFRQFSAADAEATLVRAVGLIAEAKKNGLEPEITINRALGIKEKYFNTGDTKELTLREHLISSTLRSNYENFRKLGYDPDFHTLQSMSRGTLPPVRSGSLAGNQAEVAAIIDPALSPGLETIVANLEIRPKQHSKSQLTDVEKAIALQLVTELANASIIEASAATRITNALKPQDPPKEN